jgi:adenylate cyclase
MAKEIERKFLVDPEKLPSLKNPHTIRQGYIPGSLTATVRIRISDDDAYLTIKGRATGLTRSEFEYPVPLPDAQEMLEELCIKTLIEKKRYVVPYEDHLWEIDIFEGSNEGLIIAEIELSDESETFSKPEWVTKEVSHDPKYRNSNLITHPYSSWKAS